MFFLFLWYLGLVAAHSNIAKYGRASQIDTRSGGNADRAIDGNTNGNYRYQSVTHT